VKQSDPIETCTRRSTRSRGPRCARSSATAEPGPFLAGEEAAATPAPAPARNGMLAPGTAADGTSVAS
jgi:hypothetical protein